MTGIAACPAGRMKVLSSSEVDQVAGGDFWSGAAVVGGAILAVALAPEVIAIASVAGIAALGTEIAGVGMMLS